MRITSFLLALYRPPLVITLPKFPLLLGDFKFINTVASSFHSSSYWERNAKIKYKILCINGTFNSLFIDHMITHIVRATDSPFNGSDGLGYKRNWGRITSNTFPRSEIERKGGKWKLKWISSSKIAEETHLTYCYQFHHLPRWSSNCLTWYPKYQIQKHALMVQEWTTADDS